jgi:hypothetical protein
MLKKQVIIATFALLHISTWAGPQVPDLDYADISVGELQQLLETASGSASRSLIVNRALNSRRLDLVQQCFAYPLTGANLPEKLDNISDDAFRDRVVLMLIKSEARSFWPNEKMTGSFIWHFKMIEPFVPTFIRHLPNAKPLLDILETSELRLRTAAELEAAMTGQKPPTDSTLLKNPPPTSDAVSGEVPGSPLATEKAVAEKHVLPKEAEAPRARGGWFLLLAALAAAAGVLLKWRK